MASASFDHEPETRAGNESSLPDPVKAIILFVVMLVSTLLMVASLVVR